jgi:hypothetical protein
MSVKKNMKKNNKYKKQSESPINTQFEVEESPDLLATQKRRQTRSAFNGKLLKGNTSNSNNPSAVSEWKQN